MRVALRIVSGLTILCIPIGIGFVLATANTGGDVSPLILPGFGFIALGILLAITTALLGIVASAMGRQFAWLVAMIVALLPIIGVPVVNTLAGQVDPATASTLANTVSNALLLGGPILIALVGFIYSFRMRNAAVVGMPPQATAPLR
jgi:hypothetical protein